MPPRSRASRPRSPRSRSERDSLPSPRQGALARPIRGATVSGARRPRVKLPRRRDSYERLHGSILAFEDAEDFHEAGNVEDLLNLRVGADEIYRSAVLANAFQAADQHAESGRIDISHLFQIDDQVVDAAVDERADCIFHLRRRVNVDLSAQVDDVTLTRCFTHVHLNVQNYPSAFR